MNSIQSLSLNLENPDIKLDNIDFDKINLIVGANGTGKSFLLKNCYACTLYINLCITGKLIYFSDIKSVHLAQFIYDNCFTDQKFTGKITANFTNDLHLEINFHNGDVENVRHNLTNETKSFTEIKYLSADMRTFDAMHIYLSIRKMYTSEYDLNHEEILAKMLNHYKMYDVTHLERMISVMPLCFTQEIKNTIKNYDIKDDINSMGVDLHKGFFFFNLKNGDVKNLSLYSKGEQSIINIFLSYLF